MSVGLTVYNGEPFLRHTLDSILSQTYTDFELIVSDNASTDGTQEICEEYAARDPRIRYYRNPKNLGMVPNLNRVFELSSGEFFKWADHDDILAPEFIEECVDVMDAYPDAAVCFPLAKLIDEHGGCLGDYDPLPKTDSPEPCIRFGNLITKPDGRAIQSMGLIRADLLRRTRLNGSYPSSDEVVMAHLALLGSFHEVPKRLILYRIHPRQSMAGILASERARVAHVDSSLQGRLVPIKWPYLKDCLHAINHAPLSIGQRLRCYVQVIRWLRIRKNYRSMTKDALLSIRKLIPLAYPHER